MPYFLPLIFLLVIGLFPAGAAARASINPEQLRVDQRWLMLLHMNQGVTLRSRGQSYVKQDSFFLADREHWSPQAELVASAEKLSPAESELRCEFPARYRFIAEQLGWQEAEPFAHCEEYLTWRAEVEADQLTLVFPAAYLNSPSSMFGHTLMRLDKAGQASDWGAWAINFGAITNAEENGFAYAWQGLLGGYPGRFALVPYINKIQEYSHLENRDMWEYQLNLSAEEIHWVVEHLWELREIEFAYYFLDENCSLRLLELLAVGRPSAPLLEGMRLVEIPVDTVRTIERAGLIESRHFRPSKVRELEQELVGLSRAEKRQAKRLMTLTPEAIDQALAEYAPEQRHRLARLAYQALRMQERSRNLPEQNVKTAYHLLRVMHANAGYQPAAIAVPEAPEDGHASKALTLAGGAWEEQGFTEIGFRPSYHDWLDNGTGYLQGAGLETLDLKVRRLETGQWRFWQANVVAIQSLAPRNHFVKPWSWFVRGGLDRPTSSAEPLAGYLQGGGGMGWQWGSSVQSYGYLQGRLEHLHEQPTLVTAGAGLELGVLADIRGSRFKLSGSHLQLSNEDYRQQVGVGWQLPVSRQHGIRLSGDYLKDRQAQRVEWLLAWRWYFD